LLGKVLKIDEKTSLFENQLKFQSKGSKLGLVFWLNFEPFSAFFERETEHEI
jgi:hypothetical protein